MVEDAFREAGLHSDIEFVNSGGSHVICGIEHGQHGDLGINGAKGSPMQYRRFGGGTTSAHTHAPLIVDDVYVAGISAMLFQGYNKGGTQWAHAHVVLYSNGRRCMLHMAANGRFRAMADVTIADLMAA
ncbi:hypothetical protein [Microvirga calopogonii]|uniref:hypothetical protein n=1 Tax=Microvirga calopogonii TaxID=2078013 RepID=UPI000E0CEDA3|nr:hypothetical protein [Microvirga calopogonii]